jgi:hypothetical protein
VITVDLNAMRSCNSSCDRINLYLRDFVSCCSTMKRIAHPLRLTLAPLG